LIQQCWDNTAEKRLSFPKIYEFFVKHQVAFEGTDPRAVDQRRVLETFESLDPVRTLGIVTLINKTNFQMFLSTVLDAFKLNESTDAIAGAFFDFLFVISHDALCLEIFARAASFRSAS
jgi:hypothetical protein